MQEGENDYSLEEVGCCLHCPEAYPGCLCYDCGCTKCYWYSSPEKNGTGKGYCDKVELLKERRKEEAREYYSHLEREKSKKLKWLQEENERLKKKVLAIGEIISTYSCQKCGQEFVSEKYHKIKFGKEPCCGICTGGIGDGKR